jgi:phosphonopyruvate decarboxylase
MIEARHFVEAARERGFEWYAGVPCSYLTPFINYVLQDPSLRYVSMANEGDAVALIAGVALAGGRRRGVSMMQNSGLGNAVSPLTSLTWTFRLPQLLIVTWRAQPGVPDEPQHALMGPITPKMLETMEVPWELFPSEIDAIGPALDRATAYMDQTGRPYALVMQKGTVAPYALKAGAGMAARTVPLALASLEPLRLAPEARASRQDALREVVARTPTGATAVLASTGFCGRELYAIDDRPNQLYMVGSMGCVVTDRLTFCICCWITAYMTQLVGRRLSPLMCHSRRLPLPAATLPHSKLMRCLGSAHGSASHPLPVRGLLGS